jgi:hypothetical protein
VAAGERLKVKPLQSSSAIDVEETTKKMVDRHRDG